MSLKEQITEDMKAAMKARQAEKLSAIRLLQAALKQKEIDERIAVDDDQVLAIIGKLIKQRRESIEQFGQANRQDLVERLRKALPDMKIRDLQFRVGRFA